MKTKQLFKLVKAQGGTVDASKGKGSHTQCRLNGGAFSVKVCKDVPHYVLRQAKALGLEF